MLLPMSRTARRALIGTPVSVVVLALAACGGGSSSSMSHGGVAGAQMTMHAGAHRVIATESEFKIVLSSTRLSPGTYTFVAMNQGHVPHSLEIDGPGVSGQRIPGTIPPGSSKQLTVTLRQGTYEVYCPVDSHKSLGMLDQLTVGGTAPSSTHTSTGSSTTKSSWG